MDSLKVKICGITSREGLDAAATGGAAFAGFVFFPPSPRNVTVAQAAALAVEAPPGLAKVGLFVDPDDAALDAVLDVVPLDIIQLHGDESPERVKAVKARYGLPVMKAIPLAVAADLDTVRPYGGIADMFLFDAKPPKDSVLPGGNALAFDWTILAGATFRTPWMLAGGLTPDNVALAIDRTGARMVDVSSGVERAKGVKDEGLIHAFLDAVRGASVQRIPDL